MLRLLGTIEAGPAQNQLSPVTARRLRQLLVILGLSNHQVVGSDFLEDVLWDGSPPASADTALHVAISKLRRLFEPDLAPRAASSFVVTAGDGYRLELPDDALDVERFTSALTRARSVPSDQEATVAALDVALAEFAEPVFGEFSDEIWAATYVAELRRNRADAVRRRCAAMVALGREADVVDDLEGELARNPYDERIAALLMTVLYRLGRQPDALAVFRTTRDTLRTELGLEPTPELSAVERSILLHDVDTPGADRFADLPAESSPVPIAARSLPGAARRAMFGRRRDLELVEGLLAERGLVSLLGPGGVGKTRLATEIAQRSTGTAMWIDLTTADLDDPLATLLSDQLGVDGDPLADDVRTIAAHLHDEVDLLVLDNAELLTESVAGLTAALVSIGISTSVLVTSREPLGVSGEVVHRLEPLRVSVDGDGDVGRLATDTIRAIPAVQMLCERSGLGVDDDNAEAVVALCRMLDGLPLALELAAFHLTSMGLDDLRSSWSVVRTEPGPRDFDERHRTLDSVLASSLVDLDPTARRVLDAMTAFAGPVPLAAVSALFERDLPAIEVRRAVAHLVTRSLVELVELGDGGATYRMLETIRASCRACDGFDAADAAARHRRFVRAELSRGLVDDDTALVGATLSAEVGVVLDRLADGDDAEEHLDLLTLAGTYWYRVGRVAEARQRLRQGIDLRDGDDAMRVAMARALLGLISYGEGLFDDLARQTDLALDVLEPIRAPGLDMLRAGRAVGRGELTEARAIIGAALAGEGHPGRQRLAILEMAATTAWADGDHEAALAHFGEQAEYAQRYEVLDVFGSALRGRAMMTALLGDPVGGLELCRRSEEYVVGDVELRLRTHLHAARALVLDLAGDREAAATEAVTTLKRCITHFQAHQTTIVVPIVMRHLLARDAADDAAALGGWFDGVCSATGLTAPRHVSDSLALLEADLADVLDRAALDRSRAVGAGDGLASLLERLPVTS